LISLYSRKERKEQEAKLHLRKGRRVNNTWIQELNMIAGSHPGSRHKIWSQSMRTKKKRWDRMRANR